MQSLLKPELKFKTEFGFKYAATLVSFIMQSNVKQLERVASRARKMPYFCAVVNEF
jgi:hypothetical protein